MRFSVPEAQKEYVRIAKEIFLVKTYLKKSKFNSQKLEEAVKSLLKHHLSNSEEIMLDNSTSSSYKAYVVLKL